LLVHVSGIQFQNFKKFVDFNKICNIYLCLSIFIGWFVGLEARQLLRLFAPVYNWGEIYSCDVYIKNNKKIKTKGNAV
jgi:hypothetical protein